MNQGPRSKKYRVNRTSGAASTDGVDFENYMLLQVLLRLLEDDTIEEFYIAQNVSEVMPFDDIVIRVKYNLPGSTGPVSVTKLFLVQLKYIQSRSISIEALTSTKGNGQFQLQKYFNGYKSLLKKIKERQLKDEILQECKPEDMTFIILTNAPCSVGDDNYPTNNLCRKLLETNTSESNVFQFTSSERYNEFYQQLKVNKNPIDQDEEGKNFMEHFILFAGGSKTSAVKECLKKKLKFYFSDKNINLEDVLQRAIRFIMEESSCWLSRHSGAFFDIIFRYQGVPVKLIDIVKHWDLFAIEEVEGPLYNIKWESQILQFMNKIIVQHMCLDETIEHVSVGKPMKDPESYYVDRMPIKYGQSLEDCYIASKLHEQNKMEISAINESVVLVCGDPGMGKSSYFTYQANFLKNKNPEKFVIRKDLVDLSKYLHEIEISEDRRNTTVDFLLKLSEIAPNTAEYDLFSLCLRKSRGVVLFLDGVDEVSPHYYNKLLAIIRTIRREFDVQIWLSTRPIVQKKIEKDLKIDSWILKEFTDFEAWEFMHNYCGVAGVDVLFGLEIKINHVPIFCKMLGDIIKNNQMENLNNIRNEADLYDKFVDTMYEVYNEEKKKHDVSIIATKRDLEKLKKSAMEDHEKAAVLEVFNEEILLELKWDIRNECKEFLTDISRGEEKAGLIVNIVDGRPRFIHRTIAEYFCGRWFSKNHDKFHEYVKMEKLLSGIDYHMSYKLKGLPELFKFILMQKDDEINKYLENCDEELDIVDPLGRDVLYYVLQFDVNEEIIYNIITRVKITDDLVQKVRFCYHRRTWRMLNLLLLYSFIDSLDVENHPVHKSLVRLIFKLITKRQFKSFFSYTLSRYFYLKYCKSGPLHVNVIMAIEGLGIESLLSEENINSKDDLGLTALHLAAAKHWNIATKLLCEHGAEYSNDNALGVYPHQLLRDDYECRDILKLFHKAAGSIIDDEDNLKKYIKTEDYVAQNLPLHDAVQKNDFDRIKKISAGFNDVDSRGRTALHVAAACEDTDVRIYQHLFSKNIIYTRDENALYPDDYFCVNRFHPRPFEFQRYGIERQLADLPENKDNVLEKNVRNIIKTLKYDDLG